ncbi:hypothetical protein [Rouxiella sp. WC2420]|uniref:Uncharacterized protein n=1 Tax=Rouxiella sp. WC2420 TaxID=3234145 RepID=A0AB39VQT1_9GAMM
MRKEYREFILHLLLRPDWQIAALISFLLLLILAGGYWLTLSMVIQSAAVIETQITTLREKIHQQQRTLLRQRSRAELQAVLVGIAPLPTMIPPLPQQLLAPLSAAGGKLLHWLPQRPAPIAVGQDNGLQQQGSFKLQLPFNGLVKLLDGLMTQSTAPLAIEQLLLTRLDPDKAILDVTLQLASYHGRITAEQIKQARQQFAMPLLRDPFLTESAAVEECDINNERQGLPELRGVIGDARGFTGWLRLTSGEWLRARTGDTLADGLGYVDEVSKQQVRVSFGRPRCGVKQQTFTLAGP